MSELRTDEEQAELIKKWWSENGSSVVTTVAVAVAGVVGWNFWQDQKQATGEAASATYSQLVQLAAQENDAVQGEMQTLAEQLKSDYADTAYADFGSLFIARLAAVLIQQDKADEALAVLPETADAAYAPQIEEARGDALYLKGELNNARDAYLRAMDAAQTLGQTNTTLQRKIDTLVAAGDA